MKFQSVYAAVALLATTSLASPAESPLDSRSIGSSCKAPEGSGSCQLTSNCDGISYTEAYCPNDPNNVQCCVKHSCTVSGKSGMCRHTSQGCSGGSFHAGSGAPWPCPGDNSIQCCIKDTPSNSCTVSGVGTGVCQDTSTACSGGSYHAGSGPPWPCPGGNNIQCCIKNTPSNSCTVSGVGTGVCQDTSTACSGGSYHAGSGPPWPCPGGDNIQCCIKGGSTPPQSGVGAKMLAKAKTAEGIPYAWGGGSCSGPTGDQPPYDYGEVGYDCSGLVCWALCQTTGRDLFSAGLRNTHNMYCASSATLGYKKYAYADRQPGDAVFFGPNCDCTNFNDIHHVGLVDTNLNNMVNAPNDQINKVEVSSIYSSHCPYVIRFT